MMGRTTLRHRLGRMRSIGILAVGVCVTVVGSALAQTPGSGQATVTFAKDVAPILQAKCETCHRDGSMAPMSLVTYQEVRPWARAIKNRVAAREMPPWHIDKTVGIQKFQNDMSLSDAQIDTIVTWVDAGAPLGDPTQMPPPLEWPDEDIWHLADRYGEPNLVVQSTPWTQPAEGQDQWWQPVVDTGLTEDRWVRAIEIRPSLKGRRVVHHVVAYLIQDEDPEDFDNPVDVPGSGSYFSEFAVGKIGDVFRENTGKLLKVGSQIRFDMHYHSVGEAITDQSEIGIWFYPKDVVPKYRVYARAMGVRHAMQNLDIPPGKITVHHAYVPLNLPARLENFQPHMHIRGKAMSMEAIYPDGRIEMLSYVDRFDFNWHVNYVYAEDVAPVLPKGTVLHITAWHDNTAGNRANPDPTQWVGWGQRSYDDMYHAHVNVTYLTDEDYDRTIRDRRNARRQSNQP